jgi:hypothetical protein
MISWFPPLGPNSPLQVLPPRRPASPPRWFLRALSPLWLPYPHRQSLRDFCPMQPRRRLPRLTCPRHPQLCHTQPRRHLLHHVWLLSLLLRHVLRLHLLRPRMVHHLVSDHPLRSPTPSDLGSPRHQRPWALPQRCLFDDLLRLYL